MIGCGPTGLLASAAAMEMGHQVDIWSQPKKSDLFGAQYLHMAPPLLVNVPSFEIKYELLGTMQNYRRKVYGNSWTGEVSPGDYLGTHMGWDIRYSYDQLWSLMEHMIQPVTIRNFDEANLLIDFDSYDVVFSTIPRMIWKQNNEQYLFQEVLAAGDSTYRKLDSGVPNNTVVCNGNVAPSWYRASHIDGYKTFEWPLRDLFDRPVRPPLQGVVKVRKPLSYIPDPNRPNPADTRFYHIGRYGEWRKGVLTSDAVKTVREVLADESR
ncbi:oxidoreductase [Gordonia phage DumpTruck]|nr:oxidoreductase [Gordonia phage DumpTruck]